jgi:hypothetical protein
MATPPRQPGKYGRRPADPLKPRLRLAKYLTGLPAFPPVDYLSRLSGWQMLGNDQYGDCVAVTWANTRRLVTAALATEHYPSLPQVISVYKTQNPGFPAQDDGMSIQDLLGWLTRNTPPDGSRALGFASVDHTNPAEVKQAIAVFGSVWTGFDVIAANEDEFSAGQPWDYVSGSPDVGGHSVIVGGSGMPRPGPLGGDETFITWAEETSFTDLAWSRLVGECWAVIWSEHLGSREFIDGMDLATFAADYTAITGRPFPAPVPAPPAPPAPAPGTGPDDLTRAYLTDPRLVSWSGGRHCGANKYAAQQFARLRADEGLGGGAQSRGHWS